MRRKTLLAAVAIAACAFTVWFWFLRGGDAKSPAHAQVANKPAAPQPTEPRPDRGERAPRGGAPEWTLDADPDGPIRLEGQVVDNDGNGVGGAEVWIETVPPRTTKTQDDGSFAFDHLVGRSYRLTASSGGLVGGPVTYKLTQASDPVKIALREGATIEVTVTDEKQEPVAGADVQSPGTDARSAKTDDRGKATLAGVRPGWIGVEANAPGFATGSAYTSVGTAGGKGAVAITLRRGAAVSGRVIDESGHPLAKVKVTADDRERPRRGARRGPADEQTTDADGKFTFAALAPGRHTLEATDGEHAPSRSNPVAVVADRGATGVEIVMKAGAAIAGTVVDPENKPVAFATVRVAGKGAEMWRLAARQATTDQRGHFEIRGLARTKLQARAEAETTASALVDLDMTSTAAKKDLRFVLDVSGAIAGTVVDDVGQPVAEVEVNAFPDILGGASLDGIALAGMSSATTDGAGHFAIHGLPDGAYRLWADRHVGGMGEGWGKQSTPAKAGDTSVRIVLPATGSLVGKIALETGAIPKLAYVDIGGQAASPAVAGAFELKDLAPGPYDLHIYGPEFTELVKRDVKIEPGKPTDLGTLTVVRGRRLVGRVVDPSGAPAAGVHVKCGQMLFSSGAGDANDDSQANEDLQGLRSSDTDQDGNFVLSGVPPVATVVMADDPARGQSLATQVPPGTDDPPPVTLALRGYGSVVGKVTQKGAPMPNVAVSATSKGGGAQAQIVETAADGTFTMPKVPEGATIVAATQMQMMSMKSTSQVVQVTAGQQTAVAIDIPVGSITLTVQVQALPGNQLNAAQVFLLAGNVVVSNGKQLVDGLFQGAMQGMRLWFGSGAPEFDQVVPGGYSICSIPLTGDLSDPTFMQRVQENLQALAVYCKPITVAASPAQQTVVDALPAMSPLPGGKPGG